MLPMNVEDTREYWLRLAESQQEINPMARHGLDIDPSCDLYLRDTDMCLDEFERKMRMSPAKLMLHTDRLYESMINLAVVDFLASAKTRVYSERMNRVCRLLKDTNDYIVMRLSGEQPKSPLRSQTGYA